MNGYHCAAQFKIVVGEGGAEQQEGVTYESELGEPTQGLDPPSPLVIKPLPK